MEKVILVGCGQHSNVVLYNIEAQKKYKPIGFIDTDSHKIGHTFNGLPVLAAYSKDNLIELKNKYNVENFIIAFGNMKYRKQTYEDFVKAGWSPVNIIHPQAVISPDAQIGKGVLIECGCLVTPNPIIGDNVVINTGSQVNHDNIIGNHVYIASGVVLSGTVRICENTLIDDGVIVTLGKTVGANSVIGAGSVVTKDFPENIIAYGNPAKIIRQNEKF